MSAHEYARAWRRLLDMAAELESMESEGRDAVPLQCEYDRLLARVSREG